MGRQAKSDEGAAPLAVAVEGAIVGSGPAESVVPVVVLSVEAELQLVGEPCSFVKTDSKSLKMAAKAECQRAAYQDQSAW